MPRSSTRASPRVHEVNAQGAHYYIVVDLVRGLDLRRLLDLLQQRGEALAADAAMTIAVDVAQALEHAHGRTNVLPGGVLHLGLTAPSVMLTYEGEVKLVDVGLLAALIRPGWSEDDALAPTLAYLPPEVWRGEGADVRADVFSLGVVLHELLGGGRVFLSDRAAELRKAIESGPPPPPPADPRLQQIVTRALEPDPARRFATVEEMRVAVQAILGARAERARADLSATVRRLAAPRERRTGAFAAVTLLPATADMTSPVSPAKPPPIPPARPHTWAPPIPRPPIGATLSPIPVHNTLAGIGPDDQALVPIELVELPGLPTEKAMPTVNADDAYEKRVPRATADGTASPPPPAPPPPPMAATSQPSALAADDAASRAPAANGEAASSPATGASATNGESASEPSWAPPALTPPPPSPEPLFAAPEVERPEPVEPARSSVPGVTLPPARRGGTAAVLGGVGLLAAVGALAIYAGLSGTERPGAAGAVTANQPTAIEPAAPSTTAPASAPPAVTTAHPSAAAATPRATNAPANPSAGAPATPGANSVMNRTAAPTRPTAGPIHPAATPTHLGGPAANATTATTMGSTATGARQATTATNAAPSPTRAAAAPIGPSAAPIGPSAAPIGPSAAPIGPSAAPIGPSAAPTSAALGPSAAPGPGGAAPAAPNVKAPAGPTFAIATTPDGAAVFVDGEASGTTPARVAVAPGRHTLVVLGEGYKMVKRSVDLVAGGHLDLTLEPAKLPAPIAGSDGLKVRCHSRGELRIFVDGEDSGRTCPNDERISVAAGPHKVGLYSARTGEMHELEHEVEVAEGNNSTRVYVRY